MNINFSIEEAVEKRVSVRNYSTQPVEEEKRAMIVDFIKQMDNPFQSKSELPFF
jgi:hypothetical protein